MSPLLLTAQPHQPLADCGHRSEIEPFFVTHFLPFAQEFRLGGGSERGLVFFERAAAQRHAFGEKFDELLVEGTELFVDTLGEGHVPGSVAVLRTRKRRL